MKPSRASTDSHTISKPYDHHSNSHTNNINTTTTTTSTPHIFYEPTSVLDPHLPPPSDDWDPVAWLLTDATNPTSPTPSPSPSPSFDPFDLPLDFDTYPHYSSNDTTSNNSNNIPPAPIQAFDRSHLDLLLRAAGCVEANDHVTAHMILARLNYAFPPSTTSSLPALHRAALHFRDALLSLLPFPNPPSASPPPSPLETVHRITAQKSFSDLSPIPQFTSFTANQTLLESLLLALDHTSVTATPSPPPASIHVIDFDLGLGGQWSSFAQEIHARSRSLRTAPPAVRITAVVPEETVETALAAENLRDFARAVGVRLSLDFVRTNALGTLALAGVRLSAAEPVGVVLSPTVFRLLGGSPESSAALLRFVRRVSPRVVVFVDTECFLSGGASFRRSFAGGLEFYAAVLESVDAAAAATGAGEEPVRRVERSVLRPRIFSSVSMWAPREATDWRETFAAGGMAPVAFSEFTESQAEWLLRRAPAEGFHVARCEGSMMLSWKGRELAATSAWRC